MDYFVKKGSVVREIWGKRDTILFIFAGASAEFALNKAVDWLYFTGRLPADPLGRLFSTVAYARQIIFAGYDDAIKAIDRITAIHHGVEEKRGAKIPEWAYRDVLFLLIDYSIRSFEILERKLSDVEKDEVFAVFYKVGNRMGIRGLPETYIAWLPMRETHLQQNLVCSNFTIDLYRQYKKHLGLLRYSLLKQVQQVLVPEKVRQLLSQDGMLYITPLLRLYKFSRIIKFDKPLRNTLLPAAYKAQIQGMDAH